MQGNFPRLHGKAASETTLEHIEFFVIKSYQHLAQV